MAQEPQQSLPRSWAVSRSSVELDPKYCDVIVRRWQDFTGKQATHAATGATFAEVEADSTLAVAEDV